MRQEMMVVLRWQWHRLDHKQSASRSRKIAMPTPHCSIFTGMLFLMPNQQCQSSEGNKQVMS